jgi:hypothetical protein
LVLDHPQEAYLGSTVAINDEIGVPVGVGGQATDDAAQPAEADKVAINPRRCSIPSS